MNFAGNRRHLITTGDTDINLVQGLIAPVLLAGASII